MRLSLPATKPWANTVAAALPVLLLTVIGLALRRYGIGYQSIWNDEAYSIALASKPVAAILTDVGADHLPFYFSLLHAWMLAFGKSEVAVRSLSLLFGTLAVPAIYFLGKSLFNHRIGLLSSLIAAVSPFLIYYSQETRMYSLVSLQAVVATCALVAALRGRLIWWLAYMLVSISLLYTHYYGLLFIGSQALFVSGWLYVNRRSPIFGRVLPAACLAAIAMALAFAPWALRRAMIFNTFISADADAFSLTLLLSESLITFAFGQSMEMLNASRSDPVFVEQHTRALWLSSGFASIALLGAVGLWRRPEWYGERGQAGSASSVRQSLALILVVLVGALLLVFAVSLGKRGFTARHVIFLAPFFYLLLACGLEFLRLRWRWLLIPGAAFLILFTLVALRNYYFDWRYSRDDFRGAIAFVQEHPQANEIIVGDAPYALDAIDYYFRGNAPRLGLPAEYPPDRASTERRLEGLMRYDYVWLVLWQDYFADPDSYVERWLDSHAIRVHEVTFHGGVRIRGYLTAPPLVDERSVVNPRSDQLGEQIALVGYESSRTKSGDELRVTLFLKPLTQLDGDYTISLRLLDQSGGLLAQHDARPFNGAYPTTQWPAGKIVKVEHPVALPKATAAVEARLDLGFYDASKKTIGSPGKDRLLIGPVTLSPR